MRIGRALLGLGMAISGLLGCGAKPPTDPSHGAKRIAVFPLRDAAGHSRDEVEFLTDRIRGRAADRLGCSGYLILSRENLMALVQPGTELAACEGDCEVETGRNVGADFVISGEVLPFGDHLAASLKLHSTHSAGLVGQISAEGRTLPELATAMEEATLALLAGVEPKPSDCAAASAGGLGKSGILHVESDPAGALVRVDGVEVGHTPLHLRPLPGRRILRVESPCRQPWEQVVEVDPDGVVEQRAELKPACGTVHVESEPVGAFVTLDEGKSGAAPITFVDVLPGTHTVRSTLPGHEEVRKTAEVEAGDTTSLSVDLPETGAVRAFEDGQFRFTADRLRDFHAIEVVGWGGSPDDLVRLGVGLSLLSVNRLEDVPKPFNRFGITFGVGAYLVFAPFRVLRVAVGSGISGGWISCDDSDEGAAGTAATAQCRAVTGDSQSDSNPSIGYGLWTTRALGELHFGRLGLGGGASMVVPFGGHLVKQVDFGPRIGPTVALTYGY